MLYIPYTPYIIYIYIYIIVTLLPILYRVSSDKGLEVEQDLEQLRNSGFSAEEFLKTLTGKVCLTRRAAHEISAPFDSRLGI